MVTNSILTADSCTKMYWCKVKWLMNTFWKRWSLAILFHISEWKSRFKDIKKSIPWLTGKVLSDRLKEFENFWYIIKKNNDKNIIYEVTEKTKTIKPIFISLNDLL